MANLFQLKNRTEYNIEIWNFDQLEQFLSQKRPTYLKGNFTPIFNGFQYLGPYNAHDMKDLFKEHKYEQEQALSPLEIQATSGLPKEAYHRSLVALSKNEVIGIMICQWNKGFVPFWRYHTKFIDVHKDYKHQGIGTQLIKSLDQTDFLQGHILQKGIASDEGEKFITHIMNRELNCQNYALIPSGIITCQPPIKPGNYNEYGTLITPKKIPTVNHFLKLLSNHKN